MDYFARRHLIASSSRRTLATNRLVLIVPVASGVTLALVPGVNLSGVVGNGALDLAQVRLRRAVIEPPSAQELEALRLSVVVALSATLATLPFATLAAWLVARTRFPGRALFDARRARFRSQSTPPRRHPAAIEWPAGSSRSRLCWRLRCWSRATSRRSAWLTR
ncbi:MAG TPA: hypothetical protein VNE58_14945 [Casimicrobiaceae bacterium]|nr:hypothetical protein [Casimicrobiaceae bacterium]